jgi:Phosphatidate cytidylyltransferase, mitochondrial
VVLDNRNHTEQMSKYPKDKSEKYKISQGFDGRNLQSPMQAVRTQSKKEPSQGPDLLEQRWERISNQLRSRFPEFVVAFGYGSGVIPQEGYNYTKEEDLPMVDILLVVRDTCTWSQKNLIKNPSFYRGFDKLRVKFQPMIRDKMLEFLSAGITFYPYIQLRALKGR